MEACIALRSRAARARFLVLGGFLIAAPAFAAGQAVPPAPLAVAHSRADFCAKARSNPDYFRDLSASAKNHLSFVNQGGLFNGGVCWWHSQFQRNALYLTVFRPDLPKPSVDRARDLIFAIRAGRAVTEIPGYADLQDFSRDFASEILAKLDDWQLTDGFLKQKWIHGTEPGSVQNAAELRDRMDAIYSEVAKNRRLTFVFLRSPAFGAHALLITAMRTTSDGYLYSYIDSNYPQETETVTYHRGDLTLRLDGEAPDMIPELGQTGDFKFFANAAKAYCAN